MFSSPETSQNHNVILLNNLENNNIAIEQLFSSKEMDNIIVLDKSLFWLILVYSCWALFGLINCYKLVEKLPYIVTKHHFWLNLLFLVYPLCQGSVTFFAEEPECRLFKAWRDNNIPVIH